LNKKIYKYIHNLIEWERAWARETWERESKKEIWESQMYHVYRAMSMHIYSLGDAFENLLCMLLL
jgi:hypothetical protein